jgi:methyltransferase (TIGR00027 family)
VSSEHIQHVSDTAAVTAGWRALESSRSDALFHDPLAAGMAGEHGLRTAMTLPDGAWVVAIRTVVIDAFLQAAISSGIDTVIDIGAGLDARPYRMDLPSSLRWFELDHPSVIDHKTALLRDEIPVCSVERFGHDLAERGARSELLDRIGATSTHTLALTEGVLSYLSTDEAGALADDLSGLQPCGLWITEYLSPRLLRAHQRHRPWPGAPVRFDPGSCERFYTEHGWRIRDIRYLGEESRRLDRRVPLSLLDQLMRAFTSRPLRDMGYVVLEPIA